MARVSLNSHQPLVSLPHATTTSSARLIAIDMLRGVAMILMALDHSGGFAHANYIAESYGRKIPVLGSFPNIIIGLITNVASGIFFTLTGASMAFFENSRRKRGWSEWQITRFFFIRALILVMLDLFVSKFAWGQHIFTLDVLSAIAFSMASLALLRLLPLRLIAILAAVLFFIYPFLVDWFPYNPAQPFSTVTTILFQYHVDSAPFVEFPVIGQLSLVLTGYILARLLLDNRISLSPRKLLLLSPILLIVAGILRFMGGYGNFTPYQPGSPFIYWFIESKEPPSIVFLLFNGGIALAILAFLQTFAAQLQNNLVGRVLTTFGQTALFFYVVHLLLYSIITPVIPANVLPYGGIARSMVEWALNLIMILPLCAAYRELRHRYPHSLLQYF